MKSRFEELKKLKRPVLITGHTGFKGAWLSILLRRMGIEVVGLSLPAKPGSLATQLDESIWGKQYFHDIRNRDLVTAVISDVNPSFVFHLAAQALVLESYVTPLETFETNVMGTANVLEAARINPDSRGLVVATTDKVYRNSNLGRKFVESDALMGTDPYSASKVGTEAAVQAWQTLTKGRSEFGITSVRAGNVIGGGDNALNRLLPDLIRGFSKGIPVEVRNPKSTRPWQHVADPLYGYLQTAESILEGRRPTSYNFGPREESLTVGRVVEIARESWKTPTSVTLIESDSNPYEAKLLELDSRLAENELGWAPKYSQNDSIGSTVTWWKRTMSGEMKAEEACAKDLERYEL